MMRFQVATIAVADVVVTNSVGMDAGRVGREMQEVALPKLTTVDSTNCYDTTVPQYAGAHDLPGHLASDADFWGPGGLGAAFYFAGVNDQSQQIQPEDQPLQHQGLCGQSQGQFFSNFLAFDGPRDNATFNNQTLEWIRNDADATKDHDPEANPDADVTRDGWHNNLCVFADKASNDSAWWLANSNVTRSQMDASVTSGDCREIPIQFNTTENVTDGGALFWCKLPESYFCVKNGYTTTMAPSTSECKGDDSDDPSEEPSTDNVDPTPDQPDNAAGLVVTAVAALLMA